jgi:hypothetical protein
MDDTFVKWIEQQGPLWVIYALTMVGVISVARQLFRYLPVVFEKHLTLLEKTTKLVNDSCEAINRIDNDVKKNTVGIYEHQVTISEAAKPFTKALVAMALAESREEVRRHLDEMEGILERYTKTK